MNRRAFIAALGALPVVGRFLAEPKVTVTAVGGTPAEFGSKTLVAGDKVELCELCFFPKHDTMTALSICRSNWLESQMRLTTGAFNHFGTR